MATVRGYQALTVSTAAVSPTVPLGGCTRFLMTIEGVAATAATRWRADGTAATSTVGTYSAPGKDFIFNFEANKLSLIRDTAATTDSIVHFHFLAD